MDAAIRFCGKAFGQDYAALLVKAAETADNAERKASAREGVIGAGAVAALRRP